MNLLSILKKEKEKKDYFLALIFKSYSISSILFEEESGKLHIITFHEEKTYSPVETILEKELVEICDLAISAVEKYLKEDVFVKKTIFGVPFDWVDENRIKRIYLSKLKRICDQLELTPLGFIVSLEAIVNFFQKKEGAPVSGIFVEVLKDCVVVCLVKAGNILGIKSKKIQENYLKTVEEALKEFEDIEVLPSRIVLLETDDVDVKQQEFLAYPWMQNLPFLHFPKVVVLDRGWENEAIISGVGTQMGFETLGEKESEEEGEKYQEREDSQDKAYLSDDGDLEQDEAVVSYDDFGFLKNEDVLENARSEENIDENVREKKKKLEKKVNNEIKEGKGASVFSSIFKNIIHIASYILRKSKNRTSFLKFGIGPKMILILIILIFAAGIFSYFYYSSILNADIVLFLDKKEVKKTLNITLSSEKDTSFKNASLKINLLEQEQTGEITSKTTGKKQTGEKAKGEIVIYNKTEQKKTFPEGTIFFGANKLQFELDSEVSVASTSAFSTTFSSTKGKLTAVNFGEEYNLPSETNFTLKDISSSNFFAKNESAFSGGTKRELNVVSEKDLDALSGEILEKLRSDMQENIKSKIGKEDMLLPFIISEEFVKKEFSKKQNEEANDVKIKATIKFKSAFYKKTELGNFEKELAKEEVPANFYFDEEKSKIEIKNIEMKKDKTIIAVLDVQSIYVPKIDADKLIREMAKKKIPEGEENIKALKNISDYKIIFKNKIDLLPDFLPFNSNNIHVVTRING